MAETDSRQQNKVFLQQLERQRLQKPCPRVIDLRGKVAGECQAYQIGQRTHYLDDRSYLLLKTLLQRSDNQFTVGVYEAWLKALQLLGQQDAAVRETEQAPILYRDSQKFQLLDFDSRIERREPRLNITTNIVIDADELRYHASSINISSSAMRVSMRRTQNLQTDQLILISLVTLQQEAPDGLLTEIPYRIKLLEHTTQHTIAIIQRQPADDLMLSQWFDNWLAERQQLSVMDLDSELFNLAREYYLRLFCQHFSAPLFWCDSSLHRVLFINSSDATNIVLAPLQSLLPQLPLGALSSVPNLVLSVSADNQMHWTDGSNGELLVKLLSPPAEKRYLLRTYAVTFNTEKVAAQLSPLTQRQTELAANLTDHILQCRQLVTLTDITATCRQIAEPVNTSSGIDRNELLPALDLPEAQRLSLFIARQAERFEIHTPIQLQHHQQRLSLNTNELSSGGLSVKLPVDEPINNGSRVTVDFVRWQQQSKLKLTDIPYEVRSQQNWQGMNLVGLQRMTELCSTAVNQFFDQVLAENKPKLGVRNDDLQLSLTSRLLADQLSMQLADVLLFFGLDADDSRILQAVAATQNNKAQAHYALWQALGAMAGRLTQPLKLPINELQTSHRFGIYAFRRTSDSDWQIGSDLGFKDSASKQFFIGKAMAASEQYFFNCHLQPVKAGVWTAAADLQQQLSRLRRHNSHKVKLIRETLNSLFAIAQLTDVTAIITRQYSS